MCLILFALRAHPSFPLIVAANRDEFFDRPAEPAAHWSDHPEIYAGRDLSAGGTWLGLNTKGQFAALTNFREPGNGANNASKSSRGEIPTEFLRSNPDSPDLFFNKVAPHKESYNGFNFLCGTPEQLGYFSNRGEATASIQTGVHGLSNGLMDTPWPKVASGKARLADIIEDSTAQLDSPKQISERLFDMLFSSKQAPDHELPDTGVGLEWERTLSPRFILGDFYGTRTSTVVIYDKSGGIHFFERNFDNQQNLINQGKMEFTR